MAKKKALTLDLESRRLLVRDESTLSIRRRCELLGVHRSGVYAQSRTGMTSCEDRQVMDLIDEIYTNWPFYGSRRMAVEMSDRLGVPVNRKRIQRLMHAMGIRAIGPSPSLSKPDSGHKVYPYLLRGRKITKPDEVWSTDITYVRLQGGFAYLSAVIDWFSRYVLSWQLSNTMDSGFCIEVLKEALQPGKTPEIFNTDQGSQYTCEAFANTVLATGAKLSMDGRGRALDNVFVERLWRSVKYEDIYPKGYQTLPEAESGLGRYFRFYNNERKHQSLGYRPPSMVYMG